MNICHLVENLPWFRNREWRALNPRAVYAFVQDFLKEDSLFRVSKDLTDGFQSGVVYFFKPTQDGRNSIEVSELKDCSSSEEELTHLKLSDTAFAELCNNADLVSFFAIVIKYHSGDEYHHIYHLPISETQLQSPSDVKKAIVRELHKGASMSMVPVVKQYPVDCNEYEQCNLPALRGDEDLNELAEYIGSGDSEYGDDSNDSVIIDGVYREIEEEIYSDVEVEDTMESISILTNVVFIDENGMLSKNYEDMLWTGTLDYIQTKMDYAAAPVNNKVVFTSKFSAKILLDGISVDDFLVKAEERFAAIGVAMGAFIDITGRNDRELTLYGQLCAIEFACDIRGVAVESFELASIVQLPFNGYALVRLEDEGGSADELKRPIAFTCVMPFQKRIVKMEKPVEYLYRAPNSVINSYTDKEMLYIYIMCLDRFNCFYICNGHIYLPPYSKKSGDNILSPLFKELTLCYFGKGNRDKLYAALSIMCDVEDIVLPAAAFLCPIEFIRSVGSPKVLDFIDKLFSLKRPLAEGDMGKLKELRKAATLKDVVDKLTEFEAGTKYPVSTIGLFASGMQHIPMFEQLAGCKDPDLTYQLVQELVQVMCRKEPESLVAVLTAHRSNLTPEQKERAIKAIKKRI